MQCQVVLMFHNAGMKVADNNHRCVPLLSQHAKCLRMTVPMSAFHFSEVMYVVNINIPSLLVALNIRNTPCNKYNVRQTGSDYDSNETENTHGKRGSVGLCAYVLAV